MDKQAAIQMFSRFQAGFPDLQMKLRSDDPKLDVLLDVPEQERLPFTLSFYLVGDELNITVGDRFWLEWFPSTWPNVVGDYEDAVLGLLSGQYRVVEGRWHSRLQRPKGDQWETIGTSGWPLTGLLPEKSVRILQVPAR